MSKTGNLKAVMDAMGHSDVKIAMRVSSPARRCLPKSTASAVAVSFQSKHTCQMHPEFFPPAQVSAAFIPFI
jgi:hypothetical protein